MKLVILTRKKFVNEEGFYYDIEEIEIEEYKWLKNHELEFIIKDSCRWRKLEENQEIIGMK